jgi:hypothetical protein
VTEGVVVGGWEYVIAAYTLTGLALLVYGVRLLLWLKRERETTHD